MKKISVKHKKLNKGKITEIYHPLDDKEFQDQLNEIFNTEQYKAGKKKGVFVDIGANIGLSALYFKDYATEYYAIEPSLECFKALELNTKGMNIKRFNHAVWPIEGRDFLCQTKDGSSPQTFFPDEEKVVGREEVECKPIDKFFEENNIEHVDVLKIDTEGSEYIIFPSDSFERVADKIDMIIGESHYTTSFGGIPELVPVMLEKYGFKTKFIKLKIPNIVYTMHYTGDGKEKAFHYLANTIFVATR